MNKTVFITGATKGIGKTIAHKFAEEGFHVIANYRDEQMAKKLEEELSEKGVETLFVKGDISKEEDCQNMFREIQKKFGHLDVLVNNAGITRDNLTLLMKKEEFQEVVDVNLVGVFYCLKLGAKMMLRKRKGRIISISSIVGLHGNPGQINYAASKSGVIAMTKTLALELAKKNITVNAVAPGFIETEMTETLPENVKEELLNKIPMGHYGSAEDVANAVYFLASENAKYITGQVLSIDGGMNT